MKFKYGTDVINHEKEKVGEIESVVIDPETDEISHLIVQEGLLLKEDKVVPISLVANVNQDQIKLHDFAGDFDEFPAYQEMHYVPIHQLDSVQFDPKLTPLYAYPPLGKSGFHLSPALEVVVEEENIPTSAKLIDEGANVITLDEHHVGNVEEVIFDPDSDRATHLVISKGLLLKDEKLIPVNWVKEYDQQKIKLFVDSAVIENLPEHMQE